MFRIINVTTGREIGLVENVNYIKISPTTGCYVSATRNEAIGIAYMGIAYNLSGKKEIEKADAIMVQEIDAGPIVKTSQESSKSLIKQVSDLEDVVISLYEEQEKLKTLQEQTSNIIKELQEQIAEYQEALIELHASSKEEITNG